MKAVSANQNVSDCSTRIAATVAAERQRSETTRFSFLPLR